MDGVREYEEGWQVALCRERESQRLVIVAYNEDHRRVTAVDVWDMMEWLRTGMPDGGNSDNLRSGCGDSRCS